MKKNSDSRPEGMKTKILFALALLIFSFAEKSKAQFVTIPDANFAASLQAQFPSAMSGNQMDTTDASVVNALVVNCQNQNISDITGIEYFDNLQQLLCTTNNIIFLPPLSNTVTSLDCSWNPAIIITSLPPAMGKCI